MVPFADFINHENVDTCFDMVDADGKSVGVDAEKEERKFKDEEEMLKDQEERREFVTRMSRELLELETKLRKKMLEEGHETLTEEQRNDQEISLRLM